MMRPPARRHTKKSNKQAMLAGLERSTVAIKKKYDNFHGRGQNVDSMGSHHALMHGGSNSCNVYRDGFPHQDKKEGSEKKRKSRKKRIKNLKWGINPGFSTDD